MTPNRPAGEPSGPIEGHESATASRHTLREQDVLWSRFLGFAASVVEALEKSVLAVTQNRFDLVPVVETEEEQTDRLEVQIEQDCLRILALYEPVATDLRRMATVLKVNRDWERIADLALRVARRARKLARNPSGVAMPEGLKELAVATLEQVRAAYQALATRDADAARAVIAGDQAIDLLYRQLRNQLKQELAQHSDQLSAWMLLLNSARNLERIADHALEIAQTVVYLQEGRIIRHTPEGRPPAT
jgi:phosphate transport system protein